MGGDKKSLQGIPLKSDRPIRKPISRKQCVGLVDTPDSNVVSHPGGTPRKVAPPPTNPQCSAVVSYPDLLTFHGSALEIGL